MAANINRQIQSEDKPLNIELLSILGGEQSDTRKRGLHINQNVANIWVNIAKNGLQPGKKSELIKKYPLPENCASFGALKLNPAIKRVIKEALILKDDRTYMMQKQISSCLAAIGKVITQLVKEGGTNKQYIEQLKNAGCLLASIQHSHIASRRKLILSALKADWKNIVSDTTPDSEWLFGANLEKRLRAVDHALAHEAQKSVWKKPNFKNTNTYTNEKQVRPYKRYPKPLSNEYKLDKRRKISSSKHSEDLPEFPFY